MLFWPQVSYIYAPKAEIVASLRCILSVHGEAGHLPSLWCKATTVHLVKKGSTNKAWLNQSISFRDVVRLLIGLPTQLLRFDHLKYVSNCWAYTFYLPSLNKNLSQVLIVVLFWASWDGWLGVENVSSLVWIVNSKGSISDLMTLFENTFSLAHINFLIFFNILTH